MSIVETSAASDAAISCKAAMDVSDSSFRRNPSENGRDLAHHRANNGFNSLIHQTPIEKGAPFHIENPEHQDGSKEGPEMG